jgi:hypothetical protein
MRSGEVADFEEQVVPTAEEVSPDQSDDLGWALLRVLSPWARQADARDRPVRDGGSSPDADHDDG